MTDELKSENNELTLQERLQLFDKKIQSLPAVMLQSDGKGGILIDKDKQPELYDWAVNG